jgi:pimeloyl-ACP methyl ester carboxylesterase
MVSTVKNWTALVIGISFILFSGLGMAAETIGVVLMHGKNPGGPNDPGLSSIVGKMQDAGMIVSVPNMAWSKSRYIDVDWSTSMAEVGGHIKRLRELGATRIVLAGHSMGCPAALSYAAVSGGVDAIALLAPGHVPHYYYLGLPYAPFRNWTVKESVDEARQMVAKGEGDKIHTFADINQGRRLPVWTTPRIFLSYFEPTSDAEMSVTAPRVPPHVPVLWMIGDGDRLVKEGRDYVFNKLPPNPRSRYLEIDANHLNTPDRGADRVVGWIKEILPR